MARLRGEHPRGRWADRHARDAGRNGDGVIGLDQTLLIPEPEVEHALKQNEDFVDVLVCVKRRAGAGLDDAVSRDASEALVAARKDEITITRTPGDLLGMAVLDDRRDCLLARAVRPS
jgi:hypothetical protein